MNIPEFDDFFKTITKEEISSWISNENSPTIKAAVSKDGKFILDVNELMGVSLFLTQRMLCSYHEWLRKQL